MTDAAPLADPHAPGRHVDLATMAEVEGLLRPCNYMPVMNGDKAVDNGGRSGQALDLQRPPLGSIEAE